MVSEQFLTAVDQSKRLTGKPGPTQMLELFANFRQATQDPPIDQWEAPGRFDVKGKLKLSAWKKLVEQGVTPNQAEDNYIKATEKLKEKYGYDPTKEPMEFGK